MPERGLDKSGIKLIGTGDMTDDDILNDMGDVALGAITTQFYSAAHPQRGEQGVRRRLQEGEQGHAPELHVRRRV